MATKLINKIELWNLRGDLFGGLTAAIVALPLALAFGVSSGAGAIAGLYGAIFVGFFAALFGGTPAQVSGPTGPMTVVTTTVLATLVSRHPDTGLAMAFTVVMLGGAFQILFGLLHLGQYITLMPYTVISGFMSGIGVIIIVLQLPPLLGHSGSGGVVGILQQLPTYLNQPNLVALFLGLLTLIVVFTAPPKLNRVFPSPLLALVVGTLISVVLFGDTDIDRIGAIPTGLPRLKIPTFDLGELQEMFRYGLMLGSLGAIDSLLTSLVADSISRTQHDSDKELIGQGIGNCLAGLFGGLPGAGATMRTVVNVQAGGKTPLSGMTHALVLLLVVLWAGPLTAAIPQAVLAGLLLKVGIDIIDWGFIKRAHRLSFKGTGLMYLVLFLTVFVDLITAVVVGVFIANLLTIKRLTDVQSDRVRAITDSVDGANLTPAEQEILAQAGGDILLFQLGGPLSFGAAKVISQRMTIVKQYQALVLDLTEVPTIGVTAALAIETMVKDSLKRQRQVWIVVKPGQVQQRLERLQLQEFAQKQALRSPSSLPQLYQVENRFQALQSACERCSLQNTTAEEFSSPD
ncbi:SulP family inorganic anion transporter [Desertifilum sp. FACHB-1129]|uniref:Sodium-independent anion transporter n=1 Tax=Desertifilum tharense IPPAS B-1220 TaxID=1781255 RepID=A0A1E5QHM5_9CYAN|nr:SulP family inorganic anion transporter [Desertifilum tharense]MBD2314651.1 SulP family inorganic anion transporter [Desertifilum sp. FACHB-1129]MBD2320289.1 SulP family inorganic anion transporter [Desertifilum sp. FACHB-866]MBD2330417.1 SulP family inorganic anion transporter [Desertifilum sp. FACHB-868]MDA0211328.1 SulP family inorganic anion transporter [Cyanobacteria bacterium FC1]OEJ74160.1 sodium-independent anion transporter [Desertifilum tharense IPPAS B-1220]